jgi:calpain-7
MGGYDFPGSNSNIDLHALTGWIPERVALRAKEPDFDSNGVFERLKEGLNMGRCLVTVATGDLSDADAERSGLVSTHAYAVLQMTEIDGVKLVQLKNPWSHLRWRGNYSELDVVHWTKELQEQLNFDPKLAANYGNFLRCLLQF